MTTHLQGWLEEQKRASEELRELALKSEDVTGMAIHAEARDSYKAVLQHLEDLGPLLSLDEVLEREHKGLTGPVLAAVEEFMQRAREGRAVGGSIGEHIINKLFDTFNPPVEGGDMANISEDAEDPEKPSITEQEGGGGVDAGVPHPQGPDGASCPAHTASVDSATASTEGGGVECRSGDGVPTRVSPAGHAEDDAQKQHAGVKPGAAGEESGSPRTSDHHVAGGETGDVLAPEISRLDDLHRTLTGDITRCLGALNWALTWIEETAEVPLQDDEPEAYAEYREARALLDPPDLSTQPLQETPRCTAESHNGHRCILKDGHSDWHEGRGKNWRFSFKSSSEGEGE